MTCDDHSTFDTVLVANRGEIAVRVIRTLRAMGIRSVAVFSDADAGARHVAEADVAVRHRPGARAAELPQHRRGRRRRPPHRARRRSIPATDSSRRTPNSPRRWTRRASCSSARRSTAIQTMGDKIAAKATVSAFGVPVVPGIARPGLTDDDLIAAAGDVGYPGAGEAVGRRRRQGHAGRARGRRNCRPPWSRARREAASAFGDDTLFLERFVLNPRHIEVQVLADGYGNVVHLGERECSLQRRHQKVIEEAPSPLLDAATRARIGAAACDTARSVDYTGAGTVEFIVSADRPDEFFFMEMNTRLQVEHPVTEMVTGVDLVELQVRIAAGEKLPIAQDDITHDRARHRGPRLRRGPGPRLPADRRRRARPRRTARPGRARRLRPVRAAPWSAATTTRCWPRSSPTPTTGRRRCARSTARWPTPPCSGVTTNIEFLRFLLADPDVVAGRLDTGLLDRRTADFAPAQPGDDELIAAAAYRWLRSWPVTRGQTCGTVPSGWRMGERAPTTIRLHAGERTDHVYLTGTPRSRDGRGRGRRNPLADSAALDGDRLAVTLDGLRTEYLVAAADGQIWLAGAGRTAVVDEVREAPVRPDDEHSGDAELVSPMPGSVVAVGVEDGATVDGRRRRRRGRGDEDGARAHRAGRRRGRTTRRRRRPGQGGPAAGPDHRNREEQSSHD